VVFRVNFAPAQAFISWDHLAGGLHNNTEIKKYNTGVGLQNSKNTYTHDLFGQAQVFKKVQIFKSQAT
jgi:sterol desaturase/sphingolipid hydroxylase (fatty acid hydroxylase superfamily)